MKISTSVQFDRAGAAMNKLQNDLATSQSKISSQKQVLNPSDAPSQNATILRIYSLIDRQNSYGKTIGNLQGRLDNENTTLSSASDVLIRVKELAIQASNGTQGVATRQIIATEMAGLRDQLLSLANSTDTSGSYIFAGSQVRTQPFAADSNGVVNYRGDQTRMKVEIGEQRTVPINRSGSSVFVRVIRTESNGSLSGVGFFQAVDNLIAAVRTPSASSLSDMKRGLTEMDALHQGLIMAQADAGTDMQVLAQQSVVLDDTKLNLRTVLSNVEDLDMATALTHMQKQILSLEAAQSSFAKISQLTLFSYIR